MIAPQQFKVDLTSKNRTLDRTTSSIAIGLFQLSVSLV